MLDKAHKWSIVRAFEDELNDICIDCCIESKSHGRGRLKTFYLIKYYKTRHHNIYYLCKEHADEHPQIGVSKYIIKLNEKDIFYLKTNS